MATVVLVVKGDTTNLEADTPQVGLETVFLQVALRMTEVADTDEGTVCHCVSLAFAP